MSKRSKALDARAQALFPMAREPNPMVRQYGAAVPDVTCRSCKYLVRHQYQRAFFKCRQRGTSSSTASDHRCGWTACALYEVNP